MKRTLKTLLTTSVLTLPSAFGAEHFDASASAANVETAETVAKLMPLMPTRSAICYTERRGANFPAEENVSSLIGETSQDLQPQDLQEDVALLKAMGDEYPVGHEAAH
jgi:hypothetical protein